MPAKSKSSSASVEDDVKPSIKRSYSDSESDIPITPKKKAKAAEPKAMSLPDKKTGGWSSDELWLLYTMMNPKRIGVNWSEIAAAIPGRDVKACTNKWARIQDKIEQAIKGLGE